MYTVSFSDLIKKNTLTSERSFNVQLLKQVSSLCLRWLYLPCQKIDASPSYFLSQLFLDFLIRGHVHTQMCTCVCLHIRMCTHICVIYTHCLWPHGQSRAWHRDSEQVRAWRRAPRGKGGRGGRRRVWSQLERSFVLSPRGPWSVNRTTKLVLLQARRLAFVPLLVSHGPPWEVLGQASFYSWAEKLGSLGLEVKSQSKCPQVTRTSRCVFIPTDAHTYSGTCVSVQG